MSVPGFKSVLIEVTQFAAIILLTTLAAVVYGIVHDQITVRICLEYFTIFHPPVVPTTNPTLLAFGWGVIATWWAGFLIGVPLAFCSRLGAPPRRDVTSLVRPVAKLMLVMAGGAILSGFIGWTLASNGVIQMTEYSASLLPESRQARFFADLWAHNASYAGGFIGGLVLCVRVRLAKNRAVDQQKI